MPTGEHPDVTSSLTDLERKLVDLERELNSVAGGTVAASASAPRLPPAPASAPQAGLRVDDLRGEIAGLVRFRDQLESAARELVTEYDRLVDRLRSAEPAGGSPSFAAAPDTAAYAPPPAFPPAQAPQPPAQAPQPPAQQPLPQAVAAGLPGGGAQYAPAPGPQAPPMAPPAAPGPGSQFDQMSFVGAVLVDAGPFTDITTLQAFERALGRVDGAEDVYVRSFEGDRALIDVRLSNPVPLLHLLRNALPWPIMPREAGGGRLSVDIVAADHHGI